MIIRPNRYICYKCPLCGKLVFGVFSIFEINKELLKEIACSCESSNFSIRRHNKGYRFTVPCMACEEDHSIQIPFKSLWGKSNMLFHCSVSDIPICCIGNFEDVSKWADEFEHTLESYFEDYEIENYFSNETVMYQIIDLINKMTYYEKISCECGCHDIEVELTQDQIILYCVQCGSHEAFPAKAEEDLTSLQSQDAILIKTCKKTKNAKIIEFKKSET